MLSEVMGEELVGAMEIESFVVTKPSLHDIFVRIASPKDVEHHE